MKNLNNIVLKAGNKAEIDRLSSLFQQCYNAESLKLYVSKIWPFIEASDFLEGKKPVYYKKGECAQFLARLYSVPDNIRTLYACLPEYVATATSAVIKFGFAGETMLRELNASQAISKSDYYWYTRSQNAEYMELFGVFFGRSHSNRYENEQYLFVPEFLRTVLARGIQPAMTIADMFSDEIAKNTAVYNSEKEFIASFPVIAGMHRQDRIKHSGYKITAASASRIMGNLSVKEVLRSGKAVKCSTGQYFLPCLSMSLEDGKCNSPEDYVRDAYYRFRNNYSQFILPAFLPHLRGLRANFINGYTFWGEMFESLFSEYPDKWMSLDKLLDYLYLAPTGSYVGCGVSNFDRMYIENSITGKPVYYDTQWKEIDLESIKATAVAMYGLGMVELTVENADGPVNSPCEHISQIRLTELGKYAVGLTKTYKAEVVVCKEWFRLDSEHLIVSSTSEDNPYESLLSEIASPIGGGRYLIDSSSFLKKCETPADVKDKIGFFKDYICSEPPQVWKDFFSGLQMHCQPFFAEKEDYIVLKIKDNNPDLVELLTSDSKIRSMILLVEGQRFLIRARNFQEFDKLLKSKGYLL